MHHASADVMDRSMNWCLLSFMFFIRLQFEFDVGADHLSDDIRKLDGEQAAFMKCNCWSLADPACTAFNTQGYTKTGVAATAMIPQIGGDCVWIYIKNGQCHQLLSSVWMFICVVLNLFVKMLTNYKQNTLRCFPNHSRSSHSLFVCINLLFLAVVRILNMLSVKRCCIISIQTGIVSKIRNPAAWLWQEIQL